MEDGPMSITNGSLKRPIPGSRLMHDLTKRLHVKNKETTQQFREEADKLTESEKQQLFKQKLEGELNRRSCYERISIYIDELERVFVTTNPRSRSDINRVRTHFNGLLAKKNDSYDQQVFRKPVKNSSPDVFTLVILDSRAIIFDDLRQIAYEFKS